MRARRPFLILAALAVGALFIPVKSLECPTWDIRVSNESGRPVSGITVRLSYQNYSAERQSHEMDALTDSQGHARFAATTLTATLGRRLFVTLLSARYGVHASFGPHAQVFALGDIDRLRPVWVDWSGKPSHMESRIVVR
jgi:hypothetical protein